MIKRSSPIANQTSETMQVEPLSTDEQEAVIFELKTQSEQQSASFRTIFYVLFLAIAAMFLVCFIYMVYSPWTLDHQRHFKDLVPSWAFQVYYIISASCFFVAALLVKDPTKTALIQAARVYGYLMGLVVLLSWSHIFYKHGVTNPVLIWLPIVNLVGLLLAQYIDFDTMTLMTDVEGLEKYKYEFKSV